MKNQALFSLKDKSKKLKCRLLQFLFGASRVKKYHITNSTAYSHLDDMGCKALHLSLSPV